MAKSTDEILASLLLPRGSDWRIKDVHSDNPNESIYVEVEYCKPDIVVAGKHFPIYDFRPERVWRHLDMWQYKTFIKARIPRCKLPDGKYASVEVPWADAGERMTELLEKNNRYLAPDEEPGQDVPPFAAHSRPGAPRHGTQRGVWPEH